MASDRNIYDQQAYLVKTKESNKPLEFVLDINSHENCKVCGPKLNTTKHEERVDLESELFGIDRKLSRDPKQKYQKNEKIADTLNYVPAWVCERNLSHKSFLSQNNNNEYMDKLRKLDPSKLPKMSKSKNMCKLVNFMDNNNINNSNKV